MLNESEQPGTTARPNRRSAPDYSRLEVIPAFVEEEKPAVEPVAPAAAPRPVPQKIDWQAAPLIELIDAAAQQRTQEQTEQRRWHEVIGLVRLLGIAVGAVVAFVLLIEAVQYFANSRPPEPLLHAETVRIGDEILRRFAAPGQTLAVKSVQPVLFSESGRGRAEYDLIVTLELRAPIFAPADSNGVQTYLQLQHSLRDAHRRMLEQKLFLHRPDLAHPPSLPPMLAMTHRAGERLVIKLPLEATRGGWSWRVRPRYEQMRAGPRFVGEERDRHPQPHLVFGATGTREEMRRLITEARSYILAVNAELREAR